MGAKTYENGSGWNEKFAQKETEIGSGKRNLHHWRAVKLAHPGLSAKSRGNQPREDRHWNRSRECARIYTE